MANYTKMGGLALGALAKATGGKFNSDFSMLVEELYSSSQELVQKLSVIEQILQGQVLGNADAAKIALNNAQSPDLSDEEKRAEIVRGTQLFEMCYAQLRNIPTMGCYKAEVAFCVAMSNALLGRDDLMRQWLTLSSDDFESFIALPDVKGAEVVDEVLSRGGGLVTFWGGLAVVVGVMSGAGVPFVVGSAIFTASAFKTAEKASYKASDKNNLAAFIAKQKVISLESLSAVKQVIADLPQLPENQAE